MVTPIALSMHPVRHKMWWTMFLAVTLLTLAGCSAIGTDDALDQVKEGDCTIPEDLIFDGGPGKDGIPALTDPPLVAADDISYMDNNDRVIGLMVDGRPIAVPHNILWHHEIINFNFSTAQLAVSYCPLTGSGIVFDRASVGGAEFGVSGLLYQTNLIMYDRNRDETLWSQMSRGGSCGPGAGTALTSYPSLEMTWAGWRSLFPNTAVVSGSTGHSRNYGFFPYGTYESLNSDDLLFPVTELDNRRPIKERVLGLPDGNGGMAFPFGELDTEPVRVVPFTFKGESVVIFWERERAAATVFYAESAGERMIFEVKNGSIVDHETGSTWLVTGEATGGPLVGTQLQVVKEAYVAFWFAWAVFQPDTDLFLNPTS